MLRARYNSRGWVLTLCRDCGASRYCEPHGTTAQCKRCGRVTESISIPYVHGDQLIGLGKSARASLLRYARRCRTHREHPASVTCEEPETCDIERERRSTGGCIPSIGSHTWPISGPTCYCGREQWRG